MRVIPPALLAALLLAPAGASAADTFVVEPGTSQVRIHLGRAGLLKFLGHDHTIEAPIAAGRVELDERDPSRSRVELTFEARQLAVVPGTEPEKDVAEVEARMRGAEVLDVERHPRIGFRSVAVEVEPAGAGSRRVRLHGELDLKDRRFELELPLEVRREGPRLRASGEVELELRRLGIEPPAVAGVVKVANRFRVSFAIEAHAEEVAARPAARRDSAGR